MGAARRAGLPRESGGGRALSASSPPLPGLAARALPRHAAWSLARRAARRAGLALVTLAGITLLTFAALRLLPGDPLAGDEGTARAAASPEIRARMRAALHLDEPAAMQYLQWVGGLARGDLGVSLSDGEPVGRKIADRLPATMLLAGCALAAAWAFALSLALLGASRPGGAVDRLSGAGLFALAATPVFWIGLLLQTAFAVRGRWLPLQGMISDPAAGASGAARALDIARHLVLPAACLALAETAVIARVARSSLLDALGQRFMRAARARGNSPRRALLHHAWPVAAVPLAQLIGMSLPGLVSGTFIVERVFSWPGLGTLLFDSIARRDTTTVMGLATVTAIATLAGTFVADLLAAGADPRLREARAGTQPLPEAPL